MIGELTRTSIESRINDQYRRVITCDRRHNHTVPAQVLDEQQSDDVSPSASESPAIAHSPAMSNPGNHTTLCLSVRGVYFGISGRTTEIDALSVAHDSFLMQIKNSKGDAGHVKIGFASIQAVKVKRTRSQRDCLIARCSVADQMSSTKSTALLRDICW